MKDIQILLGVVLGMLVGGLLAYFLPMVNVPFPHVIAGGAGGLVGGLVARHKGRS